MASCYWAQPKQLHPWYKPATHKRKNSAMFYRTTNESPFPVDENQYDPDSRAKRQRRITLDQACSRKRRLPSPPQSPIEDPGDPRHFKRQRCTTLERRIESLSLHPPEHSDEALSTAPVPQAPEFAARPSFPIPGSPYPMSSLPRPPLPPPVASASLCNTPAPAPVHAAPLTDADTTTDVKMHSSSWYEPEKDRIVITDLDASSDDDEADVAVDNDDDDDAPPKLPRSVLLALLRGPERDSDPRLAGLRLPLAPAAAPKLSQSPLPLLNLQVDPVGLSELRLGEAMDIEP